jgi:hypothetical protein
VPVPGGAPALANSPIGAINLTRRDIDMLRNRRSELSNQLQSAEGRRNELSALLRRPDVADRAGIEARIALLDKRLLSLEADLAETGRLLAAAGPTESFQIVPPGRSFAGLNSDQITGISVVFTLAVLMPIAIAMARRIWKRASRTDSMPTPTDFPQRFERLEQAVDAIAIEIERVSEGQRFVTRILAEGAPAPALGAGGLGAEPIPMRDRDAVALRREGT